MVLNACAKLIAHLRGHKRMSNLVLFEVVIEGYEVETQFLGDDIYRSTTGQGRIQIHHTCVETVAGIGCHVMLRLQTVVTLIPMAEADQIAVCQLAALGHTRGAAGVEEDETVGGLEAVGYWLLAIGC